jgi:hypothetical protein
MGKRHATSKDRGYAFEKEYNSEGNEIFSVELIDQARVHEFENGEIGWVSTQL